MVADQDTLARVPWRLVGNSQYFKGFAFGSRYPSLAVTVTGKGLTEAQAAAVFGLLREALPRLAGPAGTLATPADPQAAFVATVEWLLDTLHQLQIAADMPVYERGRLLAAGPSTARLLVPTIESALPLLHQVLQVILELMRYQSQDIDIGNQRGRLSEALAELNKVSATGLNIPKFIRAALEMGIPFQALTGVLQYGHGRRGRWLDSTFTDETPYIATSLARNKHFTAQVLRTAGIPTPDHLVVGTVEAALAACEKLGYPVVVKPVDQDGGIGVAAGLLSADEVRAAFQDARRYSGAILVEKHVEGRDYRVIVFHDEVIWVHERRPGGVTGDGRQTVEELLHWLNADPRRSAGPHAMFTPVRFDDEAAALLRRAGLEPGSIPEAGQFVRLRRVSSTRNGGIAVPVSEQVHPDNRLLAIRAARALRLDLAGIDMLMPDIGRSWREVGAAINDVNGQPGTRQITADLPALILRKLISGDGRIPTVIVFGAPATTPVARGLEALLLRGKVVAGCHDPAGVRINGQVVMPGAVAPYDAGLALSVDRSVGAIVLSVNDDSVLRTGLPFPRFDVLVLAGAHILPQCAVPETPNLDPVLNELLNLILPACDGAVLTVDQSGLTLNGFEPTSSAKWQHLPADAERFYSAVLEGLRDAETRHSLTWEQRSVATEPPVLAQA